MIEKNKNISPAKWNQDEETYIDELVTKENIQSWKLISKLVTKKFPGKLKTPKQCRDRYMNHIKFKMEGSLSRDWTEQQSSILFENYLKIGSRWIQIGKYLPKKSQNSIKNHFYGSLRKLLRKINTIIKQTSNKQKKPIQQKSILKLLDSQVFQVKETCFDCLESSNDVNFIWKLKYDFLRFANFKEMSQNNYELMELACRLEKFKSLTRFNHVRRSNSMTHIKRKSFPPLLCQIQESKQHQTKMDSYSETNGEDMKRKNSELNEMSITLFQELIQNKGNLFIQQSEKILDLRQGNLQQELCNILKIDYQPLNFQFYEEN